MNDEAQADFDDALARAFARIEAAKKDSENPHFRNKYADLASVTEAVKEPLTAEGFSWPQTIAMEDGLVIVTQWLRRKGVAIQSVLPMPIGDKATPQQIGSAITYARRYALSAMVGVAPDDDDGNAASSNGGGQVRAPARQRRESKPKPQEKKPGGWRANASADVLKADEVYRALCRERAPLAQELHAPNNPETIRKILGRDPDPERMTLEDWEQLNAGMRKSIADLKAHSDQMEAIADEFHGTVEGAFEHIGEPAKA